MTAPALAEAIKGAEEALARMRDEGPRHPANDCAACNLADRTKSLLAVLKEPAPAPPAPAEDATACPDCSVQETATGWTLRRCNRHRIDVRFVSVEATRGGTVTYAGPVASAPADHGGALARCEVKP